MDDIELAIGQRLIQGLAIFPGWHGRKGGLMRRGLIRWMRSQPAMSGTNSIDIVDEAPLVFKLI
jgi:hypothetical protein